MEIFDADTIPFFMFCISIGAANLSCWNMVKHIRQEVRTRIDKLSTWNLLLGNTVLPAEALTTRGQYWRKLSIGFFFCAVISGASVLYFSYQERGYEFNS